MVRSTPFSYASGLAAPLPQPRNNPRRYTIASALGVYLYSFCPMFVAVEVSASMATPAKIKKAIVLAFLLPALCVYLPTGVAVVASWGAAVPNPVTSALEPGGLSLVLRSAAQTPDQQMCSNAVLCHSRSRPAISGHRRPTACCSTALCSTSSSLPPHATA